MASYIGSDQELICPICANIYNTPRKLSGCVHSFCERCILTLFQNLKRDEKLGEEFECPVCRLPSKSPEIDTTNLSEWVQTLDIDKVLQTKVGKQNEQDSKWCSQCRYVDKFIKSVVYCSTCQDSFCGKCSETLHSFKLQRDHAIIDIQAHGENITINEQAIQLLQTFLTCSNHSEMRVEFFCQDDETFCCVNCVTTKHLGCKTIVSLKKIVEKGDDGEPAENNAAKLVVGSLSKLNDHIKSIVKLIKEKDAETKMAPKKIALQFQRIKEKVIRLLDAVEENIALESKAQSKEISIKNIDEIELLNVITSEIDVVTYLLHTLVPKLPCDSGMVCCKNAKVLLQSLERNILERGSSFETEELQLKIEEKFDSVINLGPNETEHIMSVIRNPKSFLLPRLDEKFLLRDGKVEKVGEKYCISKISPGKDPRYNSITFLTDNRQILTDSYYGICLLVDANSQSLDAVSFQMNEVTDFSNIDTNFIYSTVLENGLIAISVYNKKRICFLSAENGLEKMGQIQCKFPPAAIHGLQNGDLSVFWAQPPAFGIISLCGGSYEEKVYFKIKSNNDRRLMVKHKRRMAVDEKRQHVVLACSKGDDSKGYQTVIHCFNFDEKRIFEYSNAEIEDPKGMAIDADGNIYVCEHTFGRICVLSPAGLLVKLIQEGCPTKPLGIGFDNIANTFAVTQSQPFHGKVVFFNIKPP